MVFVIDKKWKEKGIGYAKFVGEAGFGFLVAIYVFLLYWGEGGLGTGGGWGYVMSLCG